MKDVCDILNKNKCTILRVFLLIYICIRHMGDYISQIPFVLKNGFLMCGVFFCLSGFGLSLQLSKKGDDYLNNFWHKRVFKLLIPLIVVFPIFFILKYYCQNLEIGIVKFIKNIHNSNLIIDYSWYIYEAIMLYIIFYYVAAKKKNSKVILYINLIFVILLYILKFNPCWYLSTLCFYLGICIFKRKKIKVNFLYLFVSLIVFTLLMYFYYIFHSYYLKNIFGIFACLQWCIFIIFLLSYVPNTIELNVLKKIGEISYECYLVQGLIFIIVYKILRLNPNLTTIIPNLLLIIISGFLLNKISNCIIGFTNRGIVKEKKS